MTRLVRQLLDFSRRPPGRPRPSTCEGLAPGGRAARAARARPGRHDRGRVRGQRRGRSRRRVAAPAGADQPDPERHPGHARGRPRRGSLRPRSGGAAGTSGRPVDRCWLRVTDTGTGISPDDLPASSSRSSPPRPSARAPGSASPWRRHRRRARRLDRRRERAGPGHGVHGLPAARARTSPPTRLAVMSAGRVLVVDDDRSMCEMLAGALGKRGFTVEWRTAPAAALERARRARTSTSSSPTSTCAAMSGLELCARIVAEPARRPGDRDHGVRQPRDRDRRDPRRRLRLHHQAVRDRRARASRSSAPSSTAACGTRSDGCGARSARRAGASASCSARAPPMRAGLRPARAHRRLDARRCSSPARAAPARSSSRARSTTAARAAAGRSSRSTARRCPRRCSRASSSATRAAPSPTPARRAPASSSQANGGTLFLDEIGEMPLAPAAEAAARAPGAHGAPRRRRRRGAVRRRASSPPPTATSRALIDDEPLPRGPLLPHQRDPRRRCRRCARAAATCSLLAQHFVDRSPRAPARPVTGISPAAAERLLAYAWPGNVRELQNCIERAVALTRFERDPGRRPARDGPELRALARADRRRRSRPSWCRSRRSSAATSCACVEAVGRQQDARRADPRHHAQDALPQARRVRRHRR